MGLQALYSEERPQTEEFRCHWPPECAESPIQRSRNICAPQQDKVGLAKKAEEKPGNKKLRSIVDAWKLDPVRPREQAIANSIIRGFNRNHFRRLLIEWIVDTNQPFRVVEHERLRDIFEYLNPAVNITNANISDITVRALINSEFTKHKARVIEALRKSPGLIHVSFDGWRARNRHSLYGIVCFFRDENSKPHKVALGVPEVRRHSGTTLRQKSSIQSKLLALRRRLGILPSTMPRTTTRHLRLLAINSGSMALEGEAAALAT